MRLTRFGLLLGLLLVCVCVPVRAQNLEDESELRVTEIEWGFDGTTRSKTFVPLRCVVTNRGSEGRDLTIRLYRDSGGLVPTEQYIEEVHVSAGVARAVQIVPFINDPSERWWLRWGDREDERIELSLTSADDGVALLVPRDDPSSHSGDLARFYEEQFPTTITALDGLRILAIDHEPEWSRAQQKALDDWVRIGGQVMLLKPTGGESITFGPGLEFLNRIEGATPYGAGQVRRFKREAHEVTHSVIERQFLRRRRSQGDTQHKLELYEKGQGYSYDRSAVLTTLKELSKFGQRWWLIYSIVLCYVIYQYRNGARQGVLLKATRTFYTRMIIATVVATAVIGGLSRVGSQGRDRVRTVAIARQITSGQYDIEGWAALSAGLTGGDHRFSITGEAPLYGVGESYGQNSARITRQELVVDQAAFGTQKVAYRLRAALPDHPLQSLSGDWATVIPAALKQAEQSGGIEAAAVIVGNQCQWFTRPDSTIDRSTSSTSDLQTWIRDRAAQRMGRIRLGASWLGALVDSDTDEELYAGAFGDLVGNAFRVGVNIYPDSFAVPPGMARVLVMTQWPPELAIQGDYPDADGRIIYVWDVPLRSTTE